MRIAVPPLVSGAGATRRISVGRPLSPLPVQLTVECGLHRGGSGGRCLWRGSRMVENRRAPRGDGKTQLIERKGERHPYRLVVTQSGHWPSEFAVMHNRSGGVVGCKLHEEMPSGWSVLLLTRSRRAAAGS